MDTLLGNDLVINEDSCNLSCGYCLTGQSTLKDSHRDQLIFQPPSHRDRCMTGTPLRERLDTIIDRFSRKFAPPILKLTGGEPFLIEGMTDLIEAYAPRFDRLIVQTNGVLLTKTDLDRICDLDNVLLQISLDSPFFEGNSYRVPRRNLHEKIVTRIRIVLESEIPTEIYAVLTDRNAPEIDRYLQWLLDVAPHVEFFCFPVRGPEATDYAIQSEQIPKLEKALRGRDSFSSILPPPAYIDRLFRFLTEGERNFRCHVPRLVASTFSDGTITACPNIWFSDIGNVLEDSWSAAADRMGSTGLYKALLGSRPRLDACKGCYTPWDLLSMYFDDLITLDELCSSFAYGTERIRSYLKSRKEALESTDHPNPTLTESNVLAKAPD